MGQKSKLVKLNNWEIKLGIWKLRALVNKTAKFLKTTSSTNQNEKPF